MIDSLNEKVEKIALFVLFWAPDDLEAVKEEIEEETRGQGFVDLYRDITRTVKSKKRNKMFMRVHAP